MWHHFEGSTKGVKISEEPNLQRKYLINTWIPECDDEQDVRGITILDYEVHCA